MGISVGDKNVLELAVGNALCQKGYEDVSYIFGADGSRISFSYTGSEQSFTIPQDGYYTLECWGAAGGRDNRSNYEGGRGGYAKGRVYLTAGTVLKIYVGGQGKRGQSALTDYAFNGGGRGGFSNYRSINWSNGGGGGGTDIRIGGNTLYHRLIVAGGGGGSSPNRSDNRSTMAGGGEEGNSPVASNKGTQTDGWQFGAGFASNCNGENNYYSANGGGGGWYGGGKNCGYNSSDSWNDTSWYAGGGSGFVRTGQTTVPAGYLVSEDYILDETANIKGSESMPTWDGTGTMTGNAERDGYVVITCPFFIPPKQKITTAGAYHNPDLGLISISSDGENWITMSDKNVGAENVGDNGKTFQFGNNYGFPGDGDSTAITTSSGIPNLNGYEGGNPYSDSNYRTNSSWAGAHTELWRGVAFPDMVSLRKGPCPHGFHVPTQTELSNLLTAIGDLIGEDVTMETLENYLLMPHPQVRTGSGSFSTKYVESIYGSIDVELDHDIILFGNRAPGSGGLNQTHNILGFYGLRMYQYNESSTPSVSMSEGLINTSMYIRPFRDKPIVPTTGWTRLPSRNFARLPHEYQEVEYIESSGTQYLNLGFTPPSNYLKTEIKIYPTSTGDMRAGGIYDGSNRANVHYIGMQNKIRGGFGSNDYDYYNSYSANTLYEISMEANGGNYSINFNGTPYTGTYGGTVQVSTSRPYFLFANQENGSPGEYYTGRIYYFKATTSEGLIRDLVPCYRVADGTIGMYDLVDGTFYTNVGTGTFTKGASVNIWKMPDGYTELQYIQSSGASNSDGQYVDTGYMPNNNTEFELSMSNWSNASGSFQLFGQDTSWTTGDCGTSVVTDNYSWNGPNSSTFTHGFRDGNFHLLLLNNSGLYRDGTLVHNGRAGQTFQSSVTCAIFCLHRGTTYTERSSYRFHYMRISENGDVKRDYVPCIRDSDGTLGLYDLITNTFLANQGTGSFVAGPVVFRGGFKVSANTMLYAPMDTDLSDHSFNERSLTNVGITLDTSVLQNKGVGYFRGSVDDGIQFTGAEFGSNDFTISRREKTTSSATGVGSRFSSAWHSSSWCGVLVGYNQTYLYVGDGGSSWNVVNGVQIFNSTPNTRVHRVLVKEGSNWKTYRNNVLYGTASGSGSVGYNTSVIGNYRPGDKNPFTGYMSDFILEKRAWTDQQRDEYFKATRDIYGVS